ncbi:SCAN domain-containing protein 3-like [Aphis craccivora]|uniref:SCAN domain-containing protein 3-like n=1 Tax=Aphis craccivora TaxID=307492 RepID=A0A6G0ZCC9_APHCR|nr:SCAN domain-containing protein 3-like [Aphis craccivora]
MQYGLRFIQLMKNRAYHSGIKTTPYEALFKCKIKIGLNTLNLPKEINYLTAITEKDTSTTITKIKINNKNAINLRKNATKNLGIQADEMKKLSDKKLLPVEIGSTVRVPVPDADKGRLNARNILAFVTEITDGFYRLGTKNGTLRQVTVHCLSKKLLHLDEVPAEELKS